MLPTVTLPVRPSRRGEPLWEAAQLLPEQGDWLESDYLRLNTNKLVEFTDGCIDVLPMPTSFHQFIVRILWTMLHDLRVDGRGGIALGAPFKLKLRSGKWREPDVLFLSPANRHRHRNEWWDYADLVIEVVSSDDPDRDLVTKRTDYAAAGIPEYWIVDPQAATIAVLALDGTAYRDAQLARAGEWAASVTLPAFRVDVADLFAQATV